MTDRPLLAVAIALVPMLVVALIALLTGYASVSNALWAVGCTALLLGFAAYRARSQETETHD